MEPYRILITGWRAADSTHRRLIWRTLDGITFNAYPRRIVIVHGACPYGGVDKYAADWAEQESRATAEAYPAEQFGDWPSCGPKRNSHMVSLGADLCLAWPGPGSKGTWDCARKAADAGIPTRLVALVGIEVDDE